MSPFKAGRTIGIGTMQHKGTRKQALGPARIEEIVEVELPFRLFVSFHTFS
jgi:hypothetical protein